MILCEITACVDTSGTLQKFYVSDGRFVTKATDTPAHQSFDESIIDPGSLGITAFSDGRTGGSTKLETGELILANIDGQYDNWINYSFDGRPITIYSGTSGANYPAGFVKVFTGTMESIDALWDKIIIRMRDKQFVFSTPLLATKYAGNNTAPNGVEGAVGDIKDTLKPRIYGRVFNAPCTPVNTSKLIYQISDIALNSIDAVYDKGAALTAGADFATNALLQAATPATSTFITCKAEGMFRLGSTQAGTITADATQGATAANRTVAQIVKLIAQAAGVSAGDVSSVDVAALDALNSSEVGIYIGDDASTQDCVDRLLGSVGGYCSFDSLGVLRMGRLSIPTGTPVVEIDEYEILEGVERSSPRDISIPVFRVNVNYAKNYTVQGTDVAGSVTAERRAYIDKEWRTQKSEDATIKTQWLLATEYTVDSLITNVASANTEAARQLSIYKTPKSIYELSISLELFADHNLKIMDVVTLNVPRFGLVGKPLRIIGYRLEIISSKVVVQCWG